jgi:hypothetical protein
MSWIVITLIFLGLCGACIALGAVLAHWERKS